MKSEAHILRRVPFLARPLRAIALCSLLFPLAARAVVMLEDNWDVAGEGLAGWTNRASEGGAAYGAISRDAGGYLRIARDAGEGTESDFIYDTPDGDSDHLAGNLNYLALPMNAITFKFYSDANAEGGIDYPAGLRLYFLSREGAGNYLWYYTFDVTSLNSGWNSLTAFMTAGAGAWWSYTRSASDFLSDLTDVDEVGIWLAYQPSTSGQIYGVDDFALALIPEPGAFAMLSCAFLSLGVVFRRQVGDTLLSRKNKKHSA